MAQCLQFPFWLLQKLPYKKLLSPRPSAGRGFAAFLDMTECCIHHPALNCSIGYSQPEFLVRLTRSDQAHILYAPSAERKIPLRQCLFLPIHAAVQRLPFPAEFLEAREPDPR